MKGTREGKRHSPPLLLKGKAMRWIGEAEREDETVVSGESPMAFSLGTSVQQEGTFFFVFFFLAHLMYALRNTHLARTAWLTRRMRACMPHQPCSAMLFDAVGADE